AEVLGHRVQCWERVHEVPAKVHVVVPDVDATGGDTALRDIKILLDRGILIQEQGGGRNTSYRLTDGDE
ncbi:MAG: hypothetical protein NTW72_12510, partial [Gemmatimonadetes bacterium]|nr:hypothetical protein [Gemmatimonadota bacterium]